MKIFKSICFFAFCLCVIAACKNDTTATADATKTEKDAHAGHDHAGHDHSGHDHAGHDHSGHDHAGHSHDQPAKAKMTPEQIAERKAAQEKRTAALKEPATAAQKATGDKLCACLNKISSFSKIVGMTEQAAFDKAVGDKLDDVKAMQQCHNTIVTAAIKELPADEQGVYAFKAREVANNSCLKTKDNKLWFLMGQYVTSHSGPASKVDRVKTPIKNGKGQ